MTIYGAVRTKSFTVFTNPLWGHLMARMSAYAR
jgi:hypothetical protein